MSNHLRAVPEPADLGREGIDWIKTPEQHSVRVPADLSEFTPILVGADRACAELRHAIVCGDGELALVACRRLMAVGGLAAVRVGGGAA